MKIVKVTWKDASTSDGQVVSKEMAEDFSLATAETIGYLIKEHKDRINVCSFLFRSEGDFERDGYKIVHTIPKCQIIKIEELRLKIK